LAPGWRPSPGGLRTKATPLYRRTRNLRAVHLLLGDIKLESAVRYLGIAVDDAPEIRRADRGVVPATGLRPPDQTVAVRPPPVIEAGTTRDIRASVEAAITVSRGCATRRCTAFHCQGGGPAIPASLGEHVHHHARSTGVE
jgi:hypothetical protein